MVSHFSPQRLKASELYEIKRGFKAYFLSAKQSLFPSNCLVILLIKDYFLPPSPNELKGAQHHLCIHRPQSSLLFSIPQP